MNRLRVLFGLAVSGMLLGWDSGVSAVDRFGDIIVRPQSLVVGETYHGYREFRVALENQSLKETHEVSLVFPDRAFNSGNSVSRIARTVVLPPLSRVSVPFWQPPLPQDGDSRLRISIDRGDPELISIANGGQHMNRGARTSGAPLPAVIFASRNVSLEDVSRALGANQATLSATLATGAPDSAGRRGMVNTAWMPDTSRGPHWLELDYDPPIQANAIRIYHTIVPLTSGEILLTGTSGSNIARIPITSRSAGRPRGMAMEFTFPLTSEPVKTVRLDFGTMYAGSISIDAVELMGPTSGSAWASAARASSEASLTPGVSGSPGVETRRVLRSELPVEEWSEHWISYSSYDAIALTAAELKAMPPGVQTALWRYTECGGNLLILGGGEVPETWRLVTENAFPGGQCFQAGFGQCFLLAKEQVAGLNASAIKAISDALNSSTRAWQSLPDENSANSSFPVISDLRVPVRGIVFIMLAFVLVIGPLNIVVLSRMNRRTWLLWTIPAISIFTSLVVFAYSMLREGVTADVRIEGLTFLDQPGHRATSAGTSAFYCPLTPSQGLFFTSDTEATPLVEFWNFGQGNQREVDWTESQHFERGWVTARVPSHFRLRKSEVRRERLQLENDAGRPGVINGLGAPVRSLWLADYAGNIYSATNIPPGQKAALAASGARVAVQAQMNLRVLFDQFAFADLQSFAVANRASYLAPGTYIAELDTNPFLENGLGPKARNARTRSAAIVYGILDRPEAPAGLMK